jgi:hypothetical protein
VIAIGTFSRDQISVFIQIKIDFTPSATGAAKPILVSQCLQFVRFDQFQATQMRLNLVNARASTIVPLVRTDERKEFRFDVAPNSLVPPLWFECMMKCTQGHKIVGYMGASF